MEQLNGYLGSGSVVKITVINKKGKKEDVKAVISHRNAKGEYFILAHADNPSAFDAGYISLEVIKEVIYLKQTTNKGEQK